MILYIVQKSACKYVWYTICKYIWYFLWYATRYIHSLGRIRVSVCMHCTIDCVHSLDLCMNYGVYYMMHHQIPFQGGEYEWVSVCIYYATYYIHLLGRIRVSVCITKFCIYYMVYYTMHHQIPFQGGEYEWLSVCIYYTVYHIHSLHTCIHDTTHSTS